MLLRDNTYVKRLTREVVIAATAPRIVIARKFEQSQSAYSIKMEVASASLSRASGEIADLPG
jgi:hypothetical protein